MITIKEIAELIDGIEYTEKIDHRITNLACKNNIVIVYGASDDMMEFRGAIEEEEKSYMGTTVKIDSNGIIGNRCDNCNCPYHQQQKDECKHYVKALWGTGDVSWNYETNIEHKTFHIREDGKVYCIGIVFSLDSLL